jgi:NitT/TauT family transport system substrate-binding protein
MSKKKLLILAVLILALFACSGGSEPDQESTKTAVNLRLIMSYRPDIQFAPFYVADERGYFAENGITVEFNHLSESESVQLVGADEIQFAIVSGEQVILARAQGLPIVYVMAWWQDYPIAIAASVDSGIETPADLIGKRIGFPGVYGASYVGYRALLSAAGIGEGEITLDPIGFTQAEALHEGKVDAAVVYANNEPIQLEARGFPVNVIRVADFVQLTSNGLITNEKTVADNAELVRGMIASILRGVQDTIDDPDAAYEISKDYVDGLAQADESILKGVLAASIEFWKTERLGFSVPAAWENMQRVLIETEFLKTPIDLDLAFSNEYIP